MNKEQINMDLLETQRRHKDLKNMYQITNNLIEINKQEYLQTAHTHSKRNLCNSSFLIYHTIHRLLKALVFPHTPYRPEHKTLVKEEHKKSSQTN